jgi:hypothetical protein
MFEVFNLYTLWLKTEQNFCISTPRNYHNNGQYFCNMKSIMDIYIYSHEIMWF